ncbi:uncharacterized protein LOC108698093 isoform X1 [Xenopus laevis]|uniref:Uncharacterized protein LOC108698093 isoform X1 n=1 Tax=Xenopus laevis TaxID=8355 RepID=A0A8J0TJ30_XENLA|nr:uncharacterized protein LOC108698093 isoform X1 [Xenopus laevis]
MAEAAGRLLEALPRVLCVDGRHREDSDGEAKVLLDYSMERRRKQKMLCGQLQVLRFLLEFLQQADTANWEETSAKSASQEVEEMKGKWKRLKAEYEEKVKEVEEMLPMLLQRLELLHGKREAIEEIVRRYEQKKAAVEALQESQMKEKVQKLQGAVQNQQVNVQKGHVHIQQLQGTLEKLEQSLDGWIQTVSRDSQLCHLLQTLHGVSVVSIGDSELTLDLSVDEKSETLPLQVTLRWTPSGDLCIESASSVPSLPQDLLDGSVSHLTPVILELQCWYRSQAQLLKEIGELQGRFSIDWVPEKRNLLFLKGKMQCTLYLGPGYPLSKQVQLVSLKGAPQGIDPGTCKPSIENPSLTDWLEYLHTCPNID